MSHLPNRIFCSEVFWELYQLFVMNKMKKVEGAEPWEANAAQEIYRGNQIHKYEF